MTKVSKETLITGAKKAGKFVSVLALVTTMALANPLTAAAHVDSENIIGEEQTYEDRTEIKVNDANTINNHFLGYDNYGDRYVTPEQIAKAIELSNMLNAYNNYEINEYSNTRPSEVLNLDIDDMYNEYLADAKFDYKIFCQRNITLKPALDAYLNFACGTISSEIRETIEQAAFTALYNEGAYVTGYPRFTVKDNKVYCFAEVNGTVRMIDLNIDNISELGETLTNLDSRYNLCLNNIAGYTKYYPNSFAYNGIDGKTGESAWLALGDDELKANLTNSMNFAKSLEGNIAVNLDSDRSYVWTPEDIETMRYFGFSEDQISNAIRMNATVTYTNQLVK